MGKISNNHNFGKHMAGIRKERGLTQRDLAKVTGISQRMIAYYELQSNYPPGHAIVILAKALKVSADELLGIKNVKQQLNPEQVRLWRRLKNAEALSKRDQRALLRVLDGLAAKNKSKSV